MQGILFFPVDKCYQLLFELLLTIHTLIVYHWLLLYIGFIWSSRILTSYVDVIDA